jgi:LPS export ABC transporter protein LptC
MIRYWPLLGIVALAVVVGFYLFRSEAEKERIRQPIVTDADLDDGITLNDIHYTQDDPEKGMQWVLDAKKVQFSPDRTYFSFRTFHLKLFPEDRPSLELEGHRGDYNKATGLINLQGDLKGRSVDGYRIFAEHLLYNHEEGVLTTDEWVRITGPFFTVTGKGLYFHLEREYLKMSSGVTTTLDPKLVI